MCVFVEKMDWAGIVYDFEEFEDVCVLDICLLDYYWRRIVLFF